MLYSPSLAWRLLLSFSPWKAKGGEQEVNGSERSVDCVAAPDGAVRYHSGPLGIARVSPGAVAPTVDVGALDDRPE